MALAMAVRNLQRLCTQPRHILGTRNAQLCCTPKLHNEEEESALFVAGNRAMTVDGSVSPCLDFSWQFEDIAALEHCVSQRRVDVNVKEVFKKWSEWRALEDSKLDLKKKRETLAKSLNALKRNPKNKDIISELKEVGRKLREEVKTLSHKIWDVEEAAVLAALSLPNNLHNSTGSENRLLLSLSRIPVFNFQPKGHVELGAGSRELEMLDNSPTAYYLKNRLALLELVCNDHFLNPLKDQGFSLMSNSDFVKASIVEGCGVSLKNRTRHNRLSAGVGQEVSSALHIVGGGSLQAFAAYFTKQIIDKSESLPLRVITAGRHYSPISMSYPGLLGCRQSSVVDGFVLYEDVGMQERKVFEEVMITVIQSYLNIGVHFQVVQYSADKLEAHESAAIGILMFSAHTEQYHEVGRISVCGEYISRRLWTLCRKDKAASFVSMLHVRACHTARLLALLMENMQQEDGSYIIPEYLQSAMNSY